MGPSRSMTGTDTSLVDAAIELRHRLHRAPELAFEEVETAKEIVAFLRKRGLEPFAEKIAGHGMVYRIEGTQPGPSRLFRADLDGLPLQEASGVDHGSIREGRHHACGHDGHSAMLAGALVSIFEAREGLKGTIYGLFQPAEETGEGAARVLEHDAFPKIGFDAVYSIHNLPGKPLGEIWVREGPMACASVGLEIHFEGATSHAASPHEGRNPIPSIAAFMLRAEALPATTVPFGKSALVTPISVDAGQVAYGTAAGSGRAHLTVRAERQVDLDRLLDGISNLAEALAQAGGFSLTIEEHDPFPATENSIPEVRAIERAAHQVGLPLVMTPTPMAWSEDFGHFTSRFPGALFCLGAGNISDLHTPKYDFPDELVPIGIRLWTAVALEEGNNEHE